jgi:hypothetical protein
MQEGSALEADSFKVSKKFSLMEHLLACSQEPDIELYP